MSLAALLEFQGEATIRGILGRLDPSVVIQRGRLTVLAENFVRETLRRKGRPVDAIPQAELRSAISDIAKGMDAARRTGTGPRGAIPAEAIPRYPGGGSGDMIGYKVRITIITPDGAKSDVVGTIDTDAPMGRAELFETAIEKLAKNFRIESDPKKAARAGATIDSWAVLAVYKGVP